MLKAAGMQSSDRSLPSDEFLAEIVMAHELVEQTRGPVTVDWHHKTSARLRMGVLVKLVLKKSSYPPDLEQESSRPSSPS